MKSTSLAAILIGIAIWMAPTAHVPSGTVVAAAPSTTTGTASFVSALPATLTESFSYQSSRGISVQYSIADGGSGEVFNHASGTSDAFFQFTTRSGSDKTFQILVYAGDGDALLTRTHAIPGYAPVITVPPKARVVIKDPIDEDSDEISGLVTIG